MGVLIYCALWAITALFGLPDVDRKFDVEFAVGTKDFGIARPEVLPAVRIPFATLMRDPKAWPSYVPDKPWRARTTGYAIAPFIVIDEVAWQVAPLAGMSSHRCVFWFFGYSKWARIKTYWLS